MFPMYTYVSRLPLRHSILGSDHDTYWLGLYWTPRESEPEKAFYLKSGDDGYNYFLLDDFKRYGFWSLQLQMEQRY